MKREWLSGYHDRMNTVLLMLALAATPAGAEMPPEALLPYPQVEIVTSEGRMVFALDRPRAPVTVDNFLRYVVDGHYDGTIIHRVVPEFVIQGGGYTADFAERETREPIVNESGNGLSNIQGTIAMARVDDPHSATAQWYINVSDNSGLDPNRRRWGYAVFGRIVSGLDVALRIAAIETGAAGPFPAEVPTRRVVVERVRVITPEEPE